MQKTGKIITLGLLGIFAIGAIIFSQLSYKICWNCSADDYFIRGTEYVCEERESYRRTGLDFLKNGADKGHVQAELTLAELYCNTLPDKYVASYPQQKRCLVQDVSANQEAGLSYFQSVLQAVKNGEDVGATTLNNLVLLYSDGLISEDGEGADGVWLYEKAAATGSFPAMTILGNLYQTNEQYGKALQWLSRASENSADYQSPLTVGDYHLYGKGTAVDYQKAQNWYSKAFARAQKSKAGEGKVRRQVRKLSRARLDMVGRKLEETDSNRQQVAVRYSLEGGVKHFIIFAADHPGESIGEVINENNSIHATINKKLTFSNLLPSLRQDNFLSMNEGMRWVLNVFAGNTYKDSAAMAFDFVLTDSSGK